MNGCEEMRVGVAYLTDKFEQWVFENDPKIVPSFFSKEPEMEVKEEA